MGIFDSFLKKEDVQWTPTHRAILKDLTYDEIVSTLGSPIKAKGGFVYWRAELDSLDEDYPEGVYFQVSNKDFRGFGDAAKKPKIDRDNWFILTSDSDAIRLVANELGGMPRNIESI